MEGTIPLLLFWTVALNAIFLSELIDRVFQLDILLYRIALQVPAKKNRVIAIMVGGMSCDMDRNQVIFSSPVSVPDDVLY